MKIRAVNVIRPALTAVYTVAAVLLQCSVFPHIRFLGAIPEITLCVIVCDSCFENEKFSCVLAVCAGFLLDTLGGDGLTLSPLFFLLAAAFSIFLSRRVYFSKVLPAAASGLAALLTGAAKTAVILSLRGAPFGAAVINSAMPQFVYGVIVFVPVFLLTLLHHRIFRDKEREGRRP
ncbi:MAG: hypothetical protein J6330_00945 [Clostridia bacterium]|nr:hypothetical protein [Clostridia bacterium]